MKTSALGSFAGFTKGVDTSSNLLNAGANVISAGASWKMAEAMKNQALPQTGTVVPEVVNQNLTLPPELIAAQRAEAEAKIRTQEMLQAQMMNGMSHTERQRMRYLNPEKQDNTAFFILGGVMVLGMMFIVMKDNKKSKK